MANNPPGILHKNLSVLFSLGIITAFFLNWVKWGTVPVSAKDMATGNFYTLSETSFGISNPFPEMVFANALFWLIPALGLVVLLMVLARKTYAGFYGAFAGALTLALATIYALFTREMNMFDNHIQLPGALRPGFYLAVICAVGLIACSFKGRVLVKAIFILLPLIVSYLAFGKIKESQFNEKTEATHTLKADHTVNAIDLIKEFVLSDSAANARYRGKLINITGVISELNASDSTATLSMADSTGSYAIFDFEKSAVADVKKLQAGNTVSVKALCSGGIYSEIMETETISFKQAIINH